MSDKELKKAKKDKTTSKTDQQKSKEQEYLEGWKRARADYQNLKKQMEKRMEEFRKYATEDLLQQLFPLADYFDSAFAQAPKDADANWIQGFKYIQDCFNKILADNGVERIKTVGEKFDPQLHECVKTVESDQEPNIIIKQTQAGFKLNGKVVRPAKVVISKKKIINNKRKEE